MILLALLVALLATTGVASAGTVVYREFGDVTGILGSPPDNPCTGEEMIAFGNVLLTVRSTNQGIALHINGADGGMVGADSGTYYQFNGALNEFLSYDGDYHSVHHFSWFSPTNGDRFITTYVAHTTVNGNGDVSVEFDYINGGCS
jgi:hypothetical protein